PPPAGSSLGSVISLRPRRRPGMPEKVAALTALARKNVRPVAGWTAPRRFKGVAAGGTSGTELPAARERSGEAGPLPREGQGPGLLHPCRRGANSGRRLSEKSRVLGSRDVGRGTHLQVGLPPPTHRQRLPRQRRR